MSKCPVCQASLILEEDGHKYGCYDCYFGCNPEDLPIIAAAMEMARMEYALEHCEPKHEHQYQFHLEEARKRVIEVFGGE